MVTKVYDPRSDTTKESNNPALIIAHYITDLIESSPPLELREDFWPVVAEWADYCDEEVENNGIR